MARVRTSGTKGSDRAGRRKQRPLEPQAKKRSVSESAGVRPGGNPEDLMRERNVTGRSTIAPFFMPAPLPPAPALPFGSFRPSALAALLVVLYAALSGEAAGSGSVGNTDGPVPSVVSTRPSASLGGCTRPPA